ncbi:MAG: VOC family protein [Phycisphaerales bacterium]|nr:MAG: VOC family protein [Phycisphaerales bacterium]
MSTESQPQESPLQRPGSIAWVDLTVPEATPLRDFYTQVIGWTHVDVGMGDYADYAMVPVGAGSPVAGVCHARGLNQDLPPVWLVYVVVEDLAMSIRAVEVGGGRVVSPPRTMGGGRMAVIADPTGAMIGLYQYVDQTA